MLKNRFAGNILERLKKLANAGITMNTQIVCIPGINNGNELKETIKDLYELYPAVASVAVVPIGITKFRQNLEQVKTFTKEQSAQELKMVKELQDKYIKEINEPFVRLSDEFYIVSGNEIPDNKFYGKYDQLEDGVGVVRYFKDVIDETLDDLEGHSKGSFSIATGVLAYDEIIAARDKIVEKNPNIKLDVYKIKNNYFGETITITGLLTGTDIINQLKGKINTKYLLMADCMFRKGYELSDSSEQIMLDDLKIRDIEEALDVKVIVTDYTGENLISILNEYKEEF